MAEYVSEALKSVRAARDQIAAQIRDLELEDDRLDRAELALAPLVAAEKRGPGRPPTQKRGPGRPPSTNGKVKRSAPASEKGPRLTDRVTEALSSGAFTLPELREQLDVKPQGLARVLTLLQSSGAVRKDGEKYAKVDAVGA